MSIDTCRRCDRFIDTDDDPDAYPFQALKGNPKQDQCVCEGCRERYGIDPETGLEDEASPTVPQEENQPH